MEQREAEPPGLEADVFLLVLVDHVVVTGTPLPRVLPKVTGSPATFCSSMATCSRMCPIQVPSSSVSRRMKPPGSP